MHMYAEGCQWEYKVIGGKWKGVACSCSSNSASGQRGIQIETCSKCVCVAYIMIYNPLCNKRTSDIYLPIPIVHFSNSITNVPVQGTICHPFWPEPSRVFPSLTLAPLSASPTQQSFLQLVSQLTSLFKSSDVFLSQNLMPSLSNGIKKWMTRVPDNVVTSVPVTLAVIQSSPATRALASSLFLLIKNTPL